MIILSEQFEFAVVDLLNLLACAVVLELLGASVQR